MFGHVKKLGVEREAGMRREIPDHPAPAIDRRRIRQGGPKHTLHQLGPAPCKAMVEHAIHGCPGIPAENRKIVHRLLIGYERHVYFLLRRMRKIAANNSSSPGSIPR